MKQSSSLSRHTRLLFLFLLATVSAAVAQKQRGIPYNGMDEGLVGQGKRYMVEKDYVNAAKVFETVARHSFSQSTSAAVYLSGLCYYYLNDVYFAEQKFGDIIQNYPRSRYTEDAKYHQAMLNIRNLSDLKKAKGMDELFAMAQNVKNPALQQDIRTTLAKLMYEELPLPFLQQYYLASTPKSHAQLIEPLCYRLVQLNRASEAKSYYQGYVAQAGPFGDIPQGAKNLFSEPVKVQRIQSSIIKVAVFLPLYTGSMSFDSLGNVSSRSEAGLGFYEGLKYALEDYETFGRKKICFKIFDTEKDTNLVYSQLMQAEAFAPHLVVGEVYTPQSQIVSNWAERKGITHVVPMSTKRALAEYRDHVFLAHPSLPIHGKRMAEYAYSLGLRKVAVFSDEVANTEQMADAFLSTFTLLGGETVRMAISAEYRGGASRQIPGLVSSMNSQNVDGVYMPMNNEESVGLILSLVERAMPHVRIMAAPYWQEFEAIDRDAGEKMRVLFSTAYSTRNDSTQYADFYQKHLKRYHQPPDEYQVQGYDLGKYLLRVLEGYNNPLYSFSTFLRNYPLYQGIHLGYDFRNTQENQRVHIMEYRRGGEIAKVNE